MRICNFSFLGVFFVFSHLYTTVVFYSSPCMQGHSVEMMVGAYDLGLQLSWAGEIWRPWVFIARTQCWDDGQCIWAGEIWRPWVFIARTQCWDDGQRTWAGEIWSPWVFIGSYMFECVWGQHACMICLMCSLNEAYAVATYTFFICYGV